MSTAPSTEVIGLVYEYRCRRCGLTEAASRSVAERDEPYPCHECGAMMIRRQVPVQVQIVIPAAFTAATGRLKAAEPRNATERATWDREGVRPLRDSDP